MTKSGYYRVGLFTFAGIALLALLLIVLGSGSLFKRYVYVETYFDQSVQGLSVGSPFLYRGVRLGSVAEIGLCLDKYGTAEDGVQLEEEEYRWIYVLVQVEPRIDVSFRQSREQRIQDLEEMAEQGFRVRLTSQGITGLSVLQGDYLDAEKYPIPDFAWEPEYPYVPSAESTLVRVEEAVLSISDSLTKIDFTSIGESLNRTVASIESLIASLDPSETGSTVRATLGDIRVIAAEIRDFAERLDAGRLVEDVEASTASVRDATERAASITAEVEPVVSRLLPEIEEATVSFSGAVQDVERLAGKEEITLAIEELPALVSQLDRTLRRADLLLSSGSGDIESILGNLRITAANLRDLTDLAREYPSQVIFGDAPDRTRLPRTGRDRPRDSKE